MSKRKKKAYKFVGAVPESLFCICCHKVRIEVCCLKFCEHSICQICMWKRLKNNLNTCPCTATLEEGTEEKSLLLRDQIEDLLIFCPKLCGETIRLGEKGGHYKDACQMGKVQCENPGCHYITRRKDIASHTRLCDYRTVNCEGCQKSVKFIDLRKHQICMGCVHQKLKQVVVRQLRDADRQLKNYNVTVKQDTFKTMREERNLEKEYLWKRIERNPGKYSPTLVRYHTSGNPSGRTTASTGEFSSPLLADSPVPYRASPILLRSRERNLRSAEPHVCKRCKKGYTSRVNHEESCMWHKGPIIKVFGGMCLACGRLDNLEGCEKGYHIS